jgi:DNA-binding FrmR family transcriptional regulator
MKDGLKTDLVKRLQCIEGHSRGVRRMIEDGQDCTAIIHQIKAMQGALGKVKCLLIKDYLASQLEPALDARKADDRETLLGEFARILTGDSLK